MSNINFNIKVNIDELRNQMQAMNTEINKIEQAWRNMESSISRTKSYWEGDASYLHQKYYEEINGDVNQIIKRLKEHPKNLLRIVGVYDKEEDEAVLLSSLPKDVIR